MEEDATYTEIKITRKKVMMASFLHLWLLVVLLSFMGILFFCMPKQKISVYENRNLAQFPNFTKEKLMNGTYLDSVDLYYADNFPFRDDFVRFSKWMEEHRGIRSEEIGIYIAKNQPVKADTAVVQKSDSANTADTAATTANGGEEMNTNLLIYKGMALDFFGGSLAMEKSYAATLNSYAEVLKGKNIYSLIIPTHSEFAMPEEYKSFNGRQKISIDNVNASLSGSIKQVNAYAELEKHKNEYIYFNTDHHWTALGAYYAYKAFCTTAGVAPIDLEPNLKYTRKKFLGSQYLLTLDDRLKQNPDSFYYISIPMKYKAVKYQQKSPDKEEKAVLVFNNYANYGAFLGGDFPLMKVVTENKNGKKIVVVKNSYGNAIAPFFISHYEEVYIVDYRYFKNGLVNLVKDNGIDDVIFVQCTFFVNTSWHLNKIKNLMYKANVKVELGTDSTKTDSAETEELKKDSI